MNLALWFKVKGSYHYIMGLIYANLAQRKHAVQVEVRNNFLSQIILQGIKICSQGDDTAFIEDIAKTSFEDFYESSRTSLFSRYSHYKFHSVLIRVHILIRVSPFL